MPDRQEHPVTVTGVASSPREQTGRQVSLPDRCKRLAQEEQRRTKMPLASATRPGRRPADKVRAWSQAAGPPTTGSLQKSNWVFKIRAPGRAKRGHLRALEPPAWTRTPLQPRPPGAKRSYLRVPVDI